MVTCLVRNIGTVIASLDNGFPWVITVTACTISSWFAGVLLLG